MLMSEDFLNQRYVLKYNPALLNLLTFKTLKDLQLHKDSFVEFT